MRAEETALNTSQPNSQYSKLVRQTKPSPSAAQNPEGDVDALLTQLDKQSAEPKETPPPPDRVEILRGNVVTEFIPIFVALTEKYAAKGINMEMDASNLLQGGREISFKFELGAFKSELHGTVTSDAVAFQETRYSPDVAGELASGPMMRLRTLDSDVFRDFVCQRLAILIRTALRRK